MARSFDRDLRELARLHGIQLAYKDVAGRQQRATTESLRAALEVLGVAVASREDVAAATEDHRRRAAARILPPVIVAWNGRPPEIELTVPDDHAHDRVIADLRLEDGREQRVEMRLSELVKERGLARGPCAESRGKQLPRACLSPFFHKLSELPSLSEQPVAGPEASDRSKALRWPGRLPLGYHRLRLETPTGLREALVIAAPRQAWPPPRESKLRTWGGFLPLYAVRSERNWGAGNYSDLADLARWIGELGGGVVGTLPLLPAFLDDPCDPSPYAPVTRLAWNEFFIDVGGIPERHDCPAARALVESDALHGEVAALRRADLVEYRRLMALKRRVLEPLARWFFETRPARFAALQQFLDAHPAIVDYAGFRAACERQRRPWSEWPARMRDGTLQPGDYDEAVQQFYLFAQWIAAEQMNALAESTSQSGTMLYLDLPLGTRRDGYDVWRHRGEYAARATAGAPPDVIFTRGQDWGFAPLHPEVIRERQYAHVIAYLRHHLRHARLLRMDHVMMLHRLYWIPDGLPATRGVYIRYPAEELYAILALESHRHQAVLVGENLGTVPAAVNRALDRHAIRTMHVVQYESESARDGSPGDVSATSVASLNTHDMPTFGAWWAGEDILVRRELGLLDEAGADDERRTRQRQRAAILKRLKANGRFPTDGDGSDPGRLPPLDVTRAGLADLAASPAEVVLVNFEDLWDERRPQNIPGTGGERPNWRRKAAHALEEMRKMPEVVGVLSELRRLREDGGASQGGRAPAVPPVPAGRSGFPA